MTKQQILAQLRRIEQEIKSLSIEQLRLPAHSPEARRIGNRMQMLVNSQSYFKRQLAQLDPSAAARVETVAARNKQLGDARKQVQAELERRKRDAEEKQQQEEHKARAGQVSALRALQRKMHALLNHVTMLEGRAEQLLQTYFAHPVLADVIHLAGGMVNPAAPKLAVQGLRLKVTSLCTQAQNHTMARAYKRADRALAEAKSLVDTAGRKIHQYDNKINRGGARTIAGINLGRSIAMTVVSSTFGPAGKIIGSSVGAATSEVTTLALEWADGKHKVGWKEVEKARYRTLIAIGAAALSQSAGKLFAGRAHSYLAQKIPGFAARYTVKEVGSVIINYVAANFQIIARKLALNEGNWDVAYMLVLPFLKARFGSPVDAARFTNDAERAADKHDAA